MASSVAHHKTTPILRTLQPARSRIGKPGSASDARCSAQQLRQMTVMTASVALHCFAQPQHWHVPGPAHRRGIRRYAALPIKQRCGDDSAMQPVGGQDVRWRRFGAPLETGLMP